MCECDLLTFITGRGERGLDPAALWSAAAAMLGGLAALHNKGMAHADVKPQNFLLPRADTIEGIKFCDFDGSTFDGAWASGPLAPVNSILPTLLKVLTHYDSLHPI